MLDRVLVPLDGSRLAECTVPHAVALARTFKSRITFVRVLEPDKNGADSVPMSPASWALRRAEAKRRVEEFVDRLRGIGVRTKGVVLEGEAAASITQYAREGQFDLILLSTHGQGGLGRWDVGSVARKVTMGALDAVMLVRAYRPVAEVPTASLYRRILVPLSGLRQAEAALPVADALARSHSSDLVVACLVEQPNVVRRAPLALPDTDLLARLAERNRREAASYLENLPCWLSGDASTRLLVTDDIAESLSELPGEEPADLTVVTAHAFSPTSRRPYDSIVETLISYGASNLLIIQDLTAALIRQTPACVAVERLGPPRRPSRAAAPKN